jgi:ribonuclease P protein component
VRDRRTFDELRRAGSRRRSGPITVTAVLDPDAPGPRVAYAINRTVGGAVDRNRVRRRLRAIVRDAELAPGAYLISVAPPAVRLDATALARCVSEACAR